MSLKLQIKWEKLLNDARGGDSASYHQFLSELTDWLRRILSGKIYNSSDLEDVVQEIIISVHKAQNTYDGKRPLLPWIRAIASFRVKDYLRKYYSQNNDKKVNIDDVFGLSDEKNVTEEAFEYEDVNNAIDSLNDSQKKVINLMYHQDMSVKEVAKKTGLTESNVKVTAHRAYKILRKKINER